MAFDANSTPAPSGSVVTFPRPFPAYDSAKWSRLEPGSIPPPGVVRLRPEIRFVSDEPMTPERALLRAFGRALPPRTRAKVMEAVWLAYVVDGDAVAGVAWEILTGRSK